LTKVTINEVKNAAVVTVRLWQCSVKCHVFIFVRVHIVFAKNIFGYYFRSVSATFNLLWN